MGAYQQAPGFTSEEAQDSFFRRQIGKAAWKAEGIEYPGDSNKIRDLNGVLKSTTGKTQEELKKALNLLQDPGTMANTLELYRANNNKGPLPKDVVDHIVEIQKELIEVQQS